MAYTTINKSTDHFNIKLHTGNGAEQAITGVGFQPDFTWIKKRNGTAVHYLFDAVRGATYFLNSDQTYTNQDNAQSLKSFDSDGFTLGTMAGANNNSDTFVSWNWKAGTGQGSSNTDGSINTTYTSVNTTAGFSISQYTGTGANATVGHGLGVAPKIIITKSTSHTSNWGVYNKSIGATKMLNLNQTNAAATNNGYFNDTDPTSSVFSLGDEGNDTNGSGKTYIAYCFAEKTGFSKFGQYRGNGDDDGAFVYTGFRPALVILKRDDAVDGWFMYDTKRSPINVMDDYLIPNNNAAEVGTSAVNIDFVSNGFKLRNDDGGHNNSSGTYTYLSFAEASLVGSNNVPCTAR